MPPEAAPPAADPRALDAPLAGRLADSPPGTPRYTVRAVWRTLQGEGFWAGRPAVFVRFVACNLWSGYEADRARDAARHGNGCALWCDTVFTPDGSVRLSADDLADEAAATGGDGPAGIRFAVLTGGEPLLQADAPLVAALRARGFVVAVETNGTQTLAGAFGPDPAGWPDWVVCSPKLPDAQTVIEAVDELKLVVPDYRPEAYAALAGRVLAHPTAGRLLWLQPEDGPRAAAAARLAVDLALADPRWRVSVQGHKALGVD